MAMGNKLGSVVILNADTGEVLSLVSTQSFSGNLFAATSAADDSARQTVLQQALTDERKLFFNRAVSGVYPPGSIFKLVTATAGLESGAFDLTTTVDDQGVLRVGEQSFANWYYTQYGRTEGSIALVRAIARSNDTFFYRAAEWTGIERLAAKAREFGFGALTGIEIPGEKEGLVPDPAWKEKTLGERWFLGNTYHLGIGQGDVLVTPLQLARMVGVFGNGGAVCPTTLVAGGNGARREGCSDLGISETTLSAIREGMIGACSAGGTAFPFFAWNAARKAQLPEGISPSEQLQHGVVACKTGTAEFGGENELGHRRTHAWFGMTVEGLDELIGQEIGDDQPAEATPSAMVADETQLDLNALHAQWLAKVKTAGFPREIVILVLVESDDEQPFMEGSRDAAPIALSIFDWLLGR
jgi:penicillin-binding protein 2